MECCGGGGVTYQCGQCDNMYIKGGQWQCMLHNGSISFVPPDVRHYYFYISNYYFDISTKDEKKQNIDYYFCITSMQKIKRFIKDIPFKRVLICKTIQKGSKSWNSSQIWLFFKTFKCIFKTQNSWHFFCYTDTVCCL